MTHFHSKLRGATRDVGWIGGYSIYRKMAVKNIFLYSPRLSCYHSDFKIWRRVRRSPKFTRTDTVLSYWWFEVNILQQWDKEEKDLLTGEVFTQTQTFSCKSPVWNYYRQTSRKAHAAVFSSVRGGFEVFSPRRADTLHRWGWYLACRRSTHPRQISPPSVHY